MITIARCLSEDYIHSSKLKNFCSSHGMTVSENKPELLRQIIEFAGEDESSEKYVETYDWLLEAIKEGSKEFCLKRVYVPEESIENLEQIISSKYDSCPRSDILSFKSKETASLVDYQIENDEQGIASKISFVFSTMVLEGDQENERGNRIIYPIYIDLYINEGFFVGRYKPKTTIYKCTVCFDEYSDSFPYVMKHMSPYFIIECKNETTSEGKGKTPSNTYFHKLAGIMDSNNAKIGIIVSRGEPSKEDMIIAHDNFLLHKNTNCPKFLLSFSENDLEKVIDKRQNLLQYMNYKMNVLTMNAKNPTYDMLEQENK